jgi:hypothetical protein
VLTQAGQAAKVAQAVAQAARDQINLRPQVMVPPPA